MSAECINEYISEHIWQVQEVLSLFLDATNLVKVNRNLAIVDSLKRFIWKSFKIHLANKANASVQICTLDYIMVDLPIPSYKGIVGKLNICELLTCTMKKNKRYMK